MSGRDRVKKRSMKTSYVVLALALISLIFIGGALLWTPQKGEQRKHSRSIYDDICLLYTYDVFTKMYKNPPAYPCVLSCPDVPILGYCPEEQVIRLVLYAKILEANANDVLSLALQAERIFSTIISLYIAILTGNSERAALLKSARISEENIEVNMARVAEILQKFVEKKDIRILKMISTAVEVK